MDNKIDLLAESVVEELSNCVYLKSNTPAFDYGKATEIIKSLITAINCKNAETDILVVAEKLRDEVEEFFPNQIHYKDGTIEIPVGHWAWRRLREIATENLKVELTKPEV